jgi:hypothetical protein
MLSPMSFQEKPQKPWELGKELPLRQCLVNREDIMPQLRPHNSRDTGMQNHPDMAQRDQLETVIVVCVLCPAKIMVTGLPGH